MRLLLHICCAPCGIYPFKEALKNSANQVTGFYFNPNIHPTKEYLKRRSTLEAYSRDNNLEVLYPSYEPANFFKKVINNEERPARCGICWRMRLEETALFARQNGFDAFSTTLLISPYQDHPVIKKLGEELARMSGVNFYYQDFRSGFKQSQNEAREHNIYRQNYCGCVFSKLERMEERVRV